MSAFKSAPSMSISAREANAEYPYSEMIHGTFCDKPFCCIACRADSIKRGARASCGPTGAHTSSNGYHSNEKNEKSSTRARTALDGSSSACDAAEWLIAKRAV